jgi:hypothetical protein
LAPDFSKRSTSVLFTGRLGLIRKDKLEFLVALVWGCRLIDRAKRHYPNACGLEDSGRGGQAGQDIRPRF